MSESAIPTHLLKARTFPLRCERGYVPPYPTYTSRFANKDGGIVMCILGSQHEKPGENNALWSIDEHPSSTQEDNCATDAARERMTGFFSNTSEKCQPKHYELATQTGPTGVYEQCVVGYWDTKTAYEEWKVSSGVGQWWARLDPKQENHGWYLEVFYIPQERFENAFTDPNVPEGAGHLQESVSAAIQEHGYWGSMRDRLPISQTDPLHGEAVNSSSFSTINSRTRRIRVPGKKNLAVIRSGQDWSGAPEEEQQLYTKTMYPVLRQGMDFLRDSGRQVGCYSCRFMEGQDRTRSDTGYADAQKTFGLAYFADLGALEAWSRDHETHRRIYGGFFRYSKALQNNIALRFFHEVFVLKPEQQFFEYIGCTAETGMLASF